MAYADIGSHEINNRRHSEVHRGAPPHCQHLMQMMAPSASVNPFVMQQKNEHACRQEPGGGPLAHVSYDDQLRESLGIFEEACGEDEDAEMDADTDRGDFSKEQNSNRDHDDAQVSISSNTAFVLQSRPVDKYRNDVNMKYGAAKVASANLSQWHSAAGQRIAPPMVQPSALLDLPKDFEEVDKTRHQNDLFASHPIEFATHRPSALLHHYQSEGLKIRPSHVVDANGGQSSCSSSSGNYQSGAKGESSGVPMDQLEASQQSDCETAAVSISNLPSSSRELYPSLQSSTTSCHEVDSGTPTHIEKAQASPDEAGNVQKCNIIQIKQALASLANKEGGAYHQQASKVSNVHNYLALPQSAEHSYCCSGAFDGLDLEAHYRHLSEQTGAEVIGIQDEGSDSNKKSPVALGERMDEDGGIGLKLAESDGEGASPATAAASKPSSANRQRLSGKVGTSHNHEMMDDNYSSTNSNSQINSDDKNDNDEEGMMQRHKILRQKQSARVPSKRRQHIMMEDNVTCSDDYCDHIESSRCATKKQSTVISDVNTFDSQTKRDNLLVNSKMQSSDDSCQLELNKSPEDDVLLRQVCDGCDSSLRLKKKKKDTFQGDRFIPLRSGDQQRQRLGEPGEESSHCQLQFQHEEHMLRCQTQIRKSKKRNELKSKQQKRHQHNHQGAADSHYDPLMSPTYDNDFQLADGLGAGRDGAIEDDEQVDKSPSNQSKTNSKGSPNEEKNKQIYRHMLAQQCLGDEIFNLNNPYQNLTSTSLTLPQGYMGSQMDMLMQDESKLGSSNALQMGSHSLFLDPNIGQSHLLNNDFNDPFASSSLLMRNTTESAANRLNGSPLSASTVPNCAVGDQASGNLCLQSRDRILKHSTSETLRTAGPSGKAPYIATPSHLTSFDDHAYNPLKLLSVDAITSAYDAGGMDYGAGCSSDPDSQLDFGKPRRINKMPYKVLDAPQLQDDFYLNLVDWSSTNVLAVGLNKAVYVWSACTSQVKKLCEVMGENKITSVGWSNKGNHLAVGTDDGETQIWDINHGKQIRSLNEHQLRISAIAWNGSTISTGSKDKFVLSSDLRIKNSVTHRYIGHKQEVCGLKWSNDGEQLASGGNDNKLMIWNKYSDQPVAKFSEHQAAVKAIAWCPNQSGLLATGGGTADRCIRFWNTHTLQPINCIDTGSQVCNLMFSKTSNELVSTHGYSLNQIIVWKYPSMRKIQTLTGHTYRVLYLSMSPCGSNIVTGAGDETLRFWNIFPSIKSQRLGTQGLSGGGTSSIQPSHLDMR